MSKPLLRLLLQSSKMGLSSHGAAKTKVVTEDVCKTSEGMCNRIQQQ